MKLSLAKNIIGSEFVKDGVISSQDGTLFKCLSVNPKESGLLEEDFNGNNSEQFFNKLSELLTRLPNYFEGQVLLIRRKIESDILGYETKLYFFEKVQKIESYSHLKAVLEELKLRPADLSVYQWKHILSSYLGESVIDDKIPDLIWGKDHLRVEKKLIKVLSLTELPQLTWKGCFQVLFEYPDEFILSLKINIPDRMKIKKQLETKRRVSHALSITSSLEVKNIESNSVLHSSEETLERIVVGKETLFEISVAVILNSDSDKVNKSAYDFERVISGIGNAGLFKESVGTLSVFKSHIPGNPTLNMRRLPILSSNLADIMPLILDYSKNNDVSSLELRSRCMEKSHLNLFSSENLNYNSFICGASGSGKSFLMNAILMSQLTDESKSRLCIFDVGGSYRKIVAENGGQSITLSLTEANSLIGTYLKNNKVTKGGFYKTFIETLCGGGSHITHSHRVAIEDLLGDLDGENLSIKKLIELSSQKNEKCYHDISHWLKPHVSFDDVAPRDDLSKLIQSQISAFDFKELDSNPILQRVTILLLSELLWQDLVLGTYPKTIVVFDEVWRFFAHSKSFLEEMYRTLRKYKAGIVSITQNLADYGDEAFAKMIFTNSFTKIFLQNGATREYLKSTFDLSDTDIFRALSVSSQKPKYSEFFALSSNMSQVFRLYPTEKFYELANTENISQKQKKKVEVAV
jgi:type IV secretory pathway VirB4 component